MASTQSLNGYKKEFLLANISVKNAIKNTDKAVLAGDKEKAEASLRLAIKSLDNAKSKGLVHKNKVDREKSRLTKKVNSMEAK